jgi:hypothetical protein
MSGNRLSRIERRRKEREKRHPKATALAATKRATIHP